MAIKGDFLSFKFDGHDISEFGAVRVSDGDRYSETLQPEIKDINAEVPGMHGEYYFGSTFGRRNFTVSIAFNSMTETQFRQLRRVFACGYISELVFSERPYKKYLAKIESPIELSYICFDDPKKTLQTIEGITHKEGNNYTTTHQVWRNTNATERIYKGEGTINFVCYFPFAKSLYKTLPLVASAAMDPNSINYDPYVASINDWAAASGLLSETNYNNAHIDSQIPHPTQEGVTHIHVYNPGDVATGFRLYCPFGTYNNELSIVYFINQGVKGGTEDWQEQARLTFNPITKLDNNEDGFVIDTTTGLVTGVKNYVSGITKTTFDTDGILYNRFIKKGQFFKIQPTELERTDEALIAIVNGNSNSKIFYDYLYF